ncbi:hypothetical protein EJ02DRAFT_161557 [Clathrospora elynae]|uniref:Uncharacterized protein n=1 Tax=Clathrospora elynae TaxID=706981 RepID=A0A6A5S529_9PLEO|nr:hypothetical protein EJ02DRAFT_161557 [Clathrospora elynae]
MKFLAPTIAAYFAACAMAACGTGDCCYRSYSACYNHNKLGNTLDTTYCSHDRLRCSKAVLATCSADCCNSSGKGVPC